MCVNIYTCITYMFIHAGTPYFCGAAPLAYKFCVLAYTCVFIEFIYIHMYVCIFVHDYIYIYMYIHAGTPYF